MRLDPRPRTENAHLTAPTDAPGDDEVESDASIVARAQSMYKESTDWIDGSLRPEWSRNLSNFKSKHPHGSRYHTQAYKYRSKLFRPLTRSTRRQLEAACSQAFFSNPDVLAISSPSKNPETQVTAEILKELVQHRLTHSVPWYKTAIGAYQSAAVIGTCISHQWWEYEERSRNITLDSIDEAGEPIQQEMVEVVRDRPRIDLIEPERFRIHPSCDWTDPVGSSIYLIHILPMAAQDVQQKMEEGGNGDFKPWKKHSLGQLLAASREESDDPTTQERRDGQQPRHDIGEVRGHTTIWIRRYIVREADGIDYMFHMAGNEFLLSDPVPLSEAYPHLAPGERPYTMGCASIEAFEIYPDSPVKQSEDLQASANEHANSRHDNVRLAMNQRYFIRRGADIDRRRFELSIPGSTIETTDPEADAKLIDTRDVTSAAYQESMGIRQEFDDLTGSFNSSSVAANRHATESLGEKRMMQSTANAIAEYEIKTLAETWAKSTLGQVTRLVQYYENDETVLALAAEKAELFTRFGKDKVTDDMLQNEVLVDINVGYGATDPVGKASTFVGMIGSIASLGDQAAARINYDEVIKEAVSRMAYTAPERFIVEGEDPQMQQLQQQIQELQQIIQTKQVEQQGAMDREMVKANTQFEIAGIKSDIDLAKLSVDEKIKMATAMLGDEAELTKREELALQEFALMLQKEQMEKDNAIRVEDREDADLDRALEVDRRDRDDYHKDQDRKMARINTDSKAGVVGRNDYGKVPHAKG